MEGCGNSKGSKARLDSEVEDQDTYSHTAADKMLLRRRRSHHLLHMVAAVSSTGSSAETAVVVSSSSYLNLSAETVAVDNWRK